MKHLLLDELDATASPVSALPGVDFCTPWQRFDYAVIQPGESIDIIDAGECVEQGYLVLSGQVELAAQNSAEPRARLTGANGTAPAFIIGPLGLHHSLTNSGAAPAHVLHVSVAATPAVDRRIYVGYFDADLLKWRDAIHGGSGRIATRHVLRPEDFHSTWTFLDQAVLSAGGSVGYHYHDALEECFVITKGQGYMTIDDETFAVGPGSVTWQGIGQGHGIYNPGPGELDFLRVAVAQPDEEYTTIDLHDDLAGRTPNAN
jgi:mannose-6-phosphate isomerase-like protein (cupin superfamily)